MLLYERFDALRKTGCINQVPNYIGENISSSFELRPYQVQAFENFISYFEDSNLYQKPTQTLFHMATGSGKTMMMAGLILYLYKKGYRNFLFFVNLSNIIKKTKENFLNTLSSKYLFAEELAIDGEKIKIKEVDNFQDSDNEAINICFTTIQGLHSDLGTIKENGLSIDDFKNKKIVLISDEAHHLNADTKKKKSAQETTDFNSWEQTIKYILNTNKDNVLLEFTATCDLSNPLIKANYENKIIFDYPLHKFREDKYSKEIKTLRSDVTVMERAINAIVLSQYRLKVFEENKLAIKPVVLLKASKIDESKVLMADFIKTVSELTGEELKRISELTENETISKAYSYFIHKGISLDSLAQELKEAFSEAHCISANDEKDADKNQIALNSLEDKSNPYRAIFEVKKLDEGWDVLNLFDIVRLYETKQSDGKHSTTTVSEAQLIGRGSRYCPFQLNSEQEKFKRKYDDDLDNPLRLCEELYYHCQNDSRYIRELHNALREIGIDLDKVAIKDYCLEDEFKQNEIYKSGDESVNKRIFKDRTEVVGLLPSIRNKVYPLALATGKTGEDFLLEETTATTDTKVTTHTVRLTFKEIADINYSIVQKALCKFPVYKFNILKSYFPNLKSTREFIMDGSYLGNIKIEITSKFENPPLNILNIVCVKVLSKIADKVIGNEEVKGKN